MTIKDSPGRPDETNRASADDPGQPDTTGTTGTQQTVLLSTADVAAQLQVNERTVRNYITRGTHLPGGKIVKLAAVQVLGNDYQVSQEALEVYQAARNRASTEGQPVAQLQQAKEDGQVLTSSTLQLIAAELERKNQELLAAQQTIADAQIKIERLALQAGQEAGKNEGLNAQLQQARQRVEELRAERDYWQKKAGRSYRIRLFPITDE